VVAAQTTTPQTKRVDYIILLDHEQVRSEIEQVVRNSLTNGLPVIESINHVDQTSLRFQPITVSIGTKTPDGWELHGRTQLSNWGAAHIMCLRAAALVTGAKLPEQQLALPLVLVVGSKWSVYFLVDYGDQMVSVLFLTCLRGAHSLMVVTYST